MTRAKARLDGLGEPLDDDELYYVQDTRQIAGNCLLLWCPDGKGYTCQLDLAGQFVGRYVRSMDEVHVGWPVHFILSHSVTHVRRDHLRTAASRLRKGLPSEGRAPSTAITCDPRIRSGWPCIAGTRLGVELVAESIAAGDTVEQYARDKEVTVEQVKAALEVYKGMKMLFDAFDQVHPSE